LGLFERPHVKSLATVVCGLLEALGQFLFELLEWDRALADAKQVWVSEQ